MIQRLTLTLNLRVMHANELPRDHKVWRLGCQSTLPYSLIVTQGTNSLRVSIALLRGLFRILRPTVSAYWVFNIAICHDTPRAICDVA